LRDLGAAAYFLLKLSLQLTDLALPQLPIRERRVNRARNARP
jgi:hypothetical protein